MQGVDVNLFEFYFTFLSYLNLGSLCIHNLTSNHMGLCHTK